MPGYAAGDWFAIPLRFGLFAVGRAIVVDRAGSILGYFFGHFFERLPAAMDVLGLRPGDAEIICVCDGQRIRGGAWPLIPAAGYLDARAWPIPYFRMLDGLTHRIRWTTFELGDVLQPVRFDEEPPQAGTRNWGLPMAALRCEPMSCAAVESALWSRFRAFQTGMHRQYVAEMRRALPPALLSR